ncbi:MAG: DUF448 domain-containing protein [Thermoleophilia bacterium]
MGCGRTTDKRRLQRYVIVDGRLQADPQQRLPGRGAYACDAACARRALARGGFSRSFRRAVPKDADLLHSS